MPTAATIEPTRIIVTLEVAPTAAARLSAALAAVPVASVVILPPAGGALDATVARGLVEIAQKAGVAALLADDAALARTLRADGVYLSPGRNISDAYAEAREVLGTRYIVGAGAGKSRHDAMSLGEAGAEFIGFGVPADVQDVAAARERRLELINWWGEIFEIACVAFDVTATDDASALAAAGADFIAVPLAPAMSPADIADHLAAIAAAAESGTRKREVLA
ncbi:MAG: thiamine phosphate synthase [Hyphomicrobiaceae bacterium]